MKTIRITLFLGASAIILMLVSTSCQNLASIKLPADFKPAKEDFVTEGKKGRFLGIGGFGGRVLKKRDGVNSFFDADFG